MPGFCASLGLTFSFAAVVLLVFGQVSQINSDLIPRHLRIVSIDTSGLGVAVASAARAATGGIQIANVSDIYATTGVGEDYFVKATGASPHTGLYKGYEWGLWSYCTTQGDLGAKRSYCYTRSIHPTFQPAQVLLQDVDTQYADLLRQVLPNNVFTADAYLGEWTKAASYLIMAGSLCAALTAIVGFFARRGAFVLAMLLNLAAFVGLFTGSMIWTVIVARARSAINDATAEGTDVGITLEYGNALWITWAATILSLASVVPLAFACCTGRSGTERTERIKTYAPPSEVLVVAPKQLQ
ncbi:hypothetical protein JCM8208_007191 [Rhodotorula glutinis]